MVLASGFERPDLNGRLNWCKWTGIGARMADLGGQAKAML